MSDVQWEYKQLWDFYGRRVNIAHEGEAGWELVAIEPRVPHPVAEHEIPPRYTFKRKIPHDLPKG